MVNHDNNEFENEHEEGLDEVIEDDIVRNEDDIVESEEDNEADERTAKPNRC